MQKITPFLWYNNQAEEAAKFYCGIFKNSKITSVTRMIVTFELDGQKFMALNGSPHFQFNEAISMFVNCDTQEEIDYFWDALSDDGEQSMCGWLKDKFGLSWQVVPSVLSKMMQDKDPEKVQRVSQAFLKMTKFNIEALQQAYEVKK